MDPLLTSIRKDPLAYLPEVSLQGFQHFRQGYGIRCAMEGKPHDWGYDGRAFWRWLKEHFELKGGDALNDISIVGSFSKSDTAAFYEYFGLLERFLKHEAPQRIPSSSESERLDLILLLKAIRNRPPLYLGHSSFRALHCYLIGDDRAYNDLNLKPEAARAILSSFKSWVEENKNRAQPRSWYKVIEYWSGGVDCGHSTKSGAFNLFFRWLDEYVREIGQPELFKVEITLP